jgi:hypothetical protein
MITEIMIAVPMLLYRYGNWTLLEQHERRTETAEIKFLRTKSIEFK